MLTNAQHKVHEQPKKIREDRLSITIDKQTALSALTLLKVGEGR